MDPQLNERLNAIEKTLNDNNVMLVKITKSQKNAARMRIVYWVLVILLCIASLYFIAPYLGQLAAAYGVGSTADQASVGTTPTTSNSTLTNLLNQYEAQQKAGQ